MPTKRLDKLAIIKQALQINNNTMDVMRKALMCLIDFVESMQTDIKDLQDKKLTADEFMNKYGGDK